MYRQEEKREDATRKADIHFSLSLNGGATKEKVAVYKRPGLDKFLEEASKRFEVVVFTAAIPVYAEPVLGQPYVKDLSLLGRDMSRIVLVDNNPAAMVINNLNVCPRVFFTNINTSSSPAQIMLYRSYHSTIRKLIENWKACYLCSSNSM
eukprot:1264377-Amorphochlora_amoeboformis.AAC.1